MNGIRQTSLLTGLIAFAIGLLIGWFILGWVLFPPRFVGAGPRHLSATQLDHYVQGLGARLALLGDDEVVMNAICYPVADYEAIAARSAEADINVKPAYDALLGAVERKNGCADWRINHPAQEVSDTGGLGSLLSVLCPVLAVIGLLGGVFYYLQRRPASGTLPEEPVVRRYTPSREEVGRFDPNETVDDEAMSDEEAYYDDEEEDAPLYTPPTSAQTTGKYQAPRPITPPATTSPINEPTSKSSKPTPPPAPTSRRDQPTTPMRRQSASTEPQKLGGFQTTYSRGDDSFDKSFIIENANGDFLGECGVSISEIVGTTEGVRSVTAFEIWLFDKNDTRTITKVVMSDHAYQDDALRAKLATRGESLRAQYDETIALETVSLMINAEITEIDYANVAPHNGVFDRFTIDLSAWVKGEKRS